MGTLYGVTQVYPFHIANGVVLRVKRKFQDKCIHQFNQLKEKYFTYLHTVKVQFYIENSNIGADEFEDTIVYFIIRSGGKMNSIYDKFIDHIGLFAEYLEDANFIVTAENGDFTDEFDIDNGRLIYTRNKRDC